MILLKFSIRKPKPIAFLLVLVLFVLQQPENAFAQSPLKFMYNSKEYSLSPLLEEHFGKPYLEQLIKNDPLGVVYFNFLVTQGFTFVEAGSKYDNCSSFDGVEYLNKYHPKPIAVTRLNFNILDYDFSAPANKVFKLSENGWVVVLKTEEELKMEFSHYVQSKTTSN